MMKDLKGARYELSWMPPKFNLRTYRSPPRHFATFGVRRFHARRRSRLDDMRQSIRGQFYPSLNAGTKCTFYTLVNTDLARLRLGLELVCYVESCRDGLYNLAEYQIELDCFCFPITRYRYYGSKRAVR
jgi:hypothetical protein